MWKAPAASYPKRWSSICCASRRRLSPTPSSTPTRRKFGFVSLMDNGKLRMRVADDGEGFEQTDAFSDIGGHFGLLGMRERAERLGGDLQLRSEPGEGTEVEVTVPLS